jgi:hypothetical protein
VILLANSILRGIRAPGIYACTEILQNYDFGFTKRGFIGEIISVLNVPWLYHYGFCFWLSVILLSINIMLLIDLVGNLCAIPDAGPRVGALVFASSLAVVVLAHTIGYGEQIALAVTLLSLRIQGFFARSLFTAILFPVCILIHETSLAIFFPVILFRFLIDIEALSERAKVLALSVVIACVLVALVSVSHAHLDQARAAVLYQELQARADYPLRKYNVRAITTTYWDIMMVNLGVFWRQQAFRGLILESLAVTLPTTLYFVTRSVKALSLRRRLVRWVAIIASLAPLSLHFVAWDTQRWATLATTTSFLVFAIVELDRRQVLSGSRDISERPLTLPVLLVAMNMGSTIPLFDGYIVQSFPYQEHIHDIAMMLRGEAPFPPPPALCEESGCVTTVTLLTGSRSAVAWKDLKDKPWP